MEIPQSGSCLSCAIRVAKYCATLWHLFLVLLVPAIRGLMVSAVHSGSSNLVSSSGQAGLGWINLFCVLETRYSHTATLSSGV